MKNKARQHNEHPTKSIDKTIKRHAKTIDKTMTK